MKPDEYCSKFYRWSELAQEAGVIDKTSAGIIMMAIHKSCLLDRLIYCGELGPSKTPCPVHKGRWSGINLGWPNQMWSDGTPVETQPHLQQHYDNGCRCYLHKCGCTTGWQPDDACGCGRQE